MTDNDAGGRCENDGGLGNRPEGPTVEGDGGVTSLEVVFDCLTHPKRRVMLYYLQHHEIVTVNELARHVAGWDAGVPPDEVDPEHRDGIASELVHSHLPKLRDASFIEYDQRSKTIRYTDPPELLAEVLRLLAELDTASPR